MTWFHCILYILACTLSDQHLAGSVTASETNDTISKSSSKPNLSKTQRASSVHDGVVSNSVKAAGFLTWINQMKIQSQRQRIFSALKQPHDFRHHSHEDLEKVMKNVNNKYPNITYLYSIGKSVQGRELWAIAISDFPHIHEPGEPEFQYIGNMHGNEVVGRELLLMLIEFLCENHVTEGLPRRKPKEKEAKMIHWLITNTRIHILPTMNPDGHAIAKEGDVQSVIGRPNAHHKDLNRNFPDRFGGTPPSEPETEAVMNWLRSYNFVLAANLHNGALVANYPFDASPDGRSKEMPSPDNDIFKQLALAYSSPHPEMSTGDSCKNMPRYQEHFDKGITNGASWYSVKGGMQDWAYLHTNTFEITVEVGCTKYPYQNKLSQLWMSNLGSLLSFIAEIHKGLAGFILDSENQTPIQHAVIQVSKMSSELSSEINHDVTSGFDGDFWRLLVPGHYKVKVSAVGFQTITKRIVVNEGPATIVKLYLKKNSPARSDNELSKDNVPKNHLPEIKNVNMPKQVYGFSLTTFLGLATLFVGVFFLTFAALCFCHMKTKRTPLNSQTAGFRRFDLDNDGIDSKTNKDYNDRIALMTSVDNVIPYRDCSDSEDEIYFSR